MLRMFTSEYAKSAFRATWRKIPKRDRRILENRIWLVTDAPYLLLNDVVENHIESTPELGGLAIRVDGGNCCVFVNSRNAGAMTMARFVIAHELAHVFLNHFDDAKPIEIEESEANLQAQSWGFTEVLTRHDMM